MTSNKVTDGEVIVHADELKTGRLYVLEENEGGDHLRHLPRDIDDLPKLRLMNDALAALRTFCRGARREMQGYKPDLTMAASALLLDAVKQPGATKVVRDYFLSTLGDSDDASAETK